MVDVVGFNNQIRRAHTERTVHTWKLRNLSAAVKAGNAGFRIESYGIFVSQILGTFLICSSCFWLNDPLRQYFSLYRAVSQREGERREN